MTVKAKKKNKIGVIVAAGILIKYENKILLVKPIKSNAKKRTWGIPKGKLDFNETYADAASRETREEIGVDIDSSLLNKYYEMSYKNYKTKEVYKKIYYFVHEIKSLDEIGLNKEKVPKKQLSKREIQKAKFFTKEKAYKCIFWKQKDVLKHFDDE